MAIFELLSLPATFPDLIGAPCALEGPSRTCITSRVSCDANKGKCVICIIFLISEWLPHHLKMFWKPIHFGKHSLGVKRWGLRKRKRAGREGGGSMTLGATTWWGQLSKPRGSLLLLLHHLLLRRSDYRFHAFNWVHCCLISITHAFSFLCSLGSRQPGKGNVLTNIRHMDPNTINLQSWEDA